MGFLRAIALLLFCMASTLSMGPHRGHRGRDKGQSSDHFGKGIGSLSHFTSAVWVQIPAHMRVPMDCCRCWASGCCSCGSPWEQAGWRGGARRVLTWLSSKEDMLSLSHYRCLENRGDQELEFSWNHRKAFKILLENFNYKKANYFAFNLSECNVHQLT